MSQGQGKGHGGIGPDPIQWLHDSRSINRSNDIIVLGEANLSAENSGKPLGGRAPSRTPLGELSAPPDPIAGGKGVAAPSPITPSPLSAFGPSVLATH